jgi:pterin-4a-carbinolamine dehydratase
VAQKAAARKFRDQLRALPGWRQVAGRPAIDRTKEFTDAQAAARYAVAVHELADSKGQPVWVLLAGAKVIVTLWGRDQDGAPRELNEAVLDFARLLP